MGYRNYFYLCSKKNIDEILELSIKNENFYSENDQGKELCKEIYEFGKYCEFNKLLYSVGTVVHQKDWDNELVFFKNKKPFEIVIDFYGNKVKDYFNNLLKDDEDDYFNENTREKKIQREINEKIREWNRFKTFVLNLDLEDEKIVNSWKYEYELFELVRLYKTIDLENNILIFCGY